MFTSLLPFLILIPTAVVCCYPMKNSFRYPVRTTALRLGLMTLGLIIAAALLRFYSGIDVNLILILTLPVLFCLYQKILNVPVYKSLAVFLWCSALMAILSNFAGGFDALHNPASGIDAESTDFTIFQTGLGTAAALILYYPVTKYGSDLIDRLNLPTIWYLTTPFSLIFLLSNILLRPHRYETLYTNNVFLAFWSILSATLLIWALLTVMFYHIVTGILNAAKTEERNRFLEMQEAQFRSQQKYMEESARVRHDFKQTIRTMQELSRTGKYKELAEFLDKFADTLPENEFVRFSSNTPLNALLNYYVQTCVRQKIKLDLKIDLPEKLPVSDIDLCGMIGNVLDNAVTACLKVPETERWIQLTALTKNDAQLFIITTNSFSGKVKMKDEQYLSTGRRGTGLGLSSIRTTAERYNGTAEFSHQGREFYTDIVIPLP